MHIIHQAIPEDMIPVDFLHIHHAICKPTLTSSKYSFQGIGVGENAAIAHQLSYYELYERMLGSTDFKDSSRQIKGSWENLKNMGIPVFDISTINLFHEKQVLQANNVHRRRIESTTILNWTKCHYGLDEKEIYLPNIFAYSNIASEFYFSNTAGSALHTSYKEAKIGALYELIEKASISKMWYSQNIKIPPFYTFSNIQHLLSEPYKELIKKKGFEFSFFHDQLEDTHTILCLCKFNVAGEKKISVGSSCNMSISKSIEKSIAECIKNIVMIKNYMHLNKLKDYSNINKVTGYLPHFLYFNYHYPKVTAPIIEATIKDKPSLEGLDERWIEPIEKEYEMELYERFVQKYKLVCYTHNHAVNDEEYCFVKLFSPQFLPLSSHHMFPYLGNLNEEMYADLYTEIPHFFP